MLKTLERAERTEEKALGLTGNGVGTQSQPVKAVSVYIPDWTGVKANGQAIVVAQVKDVTEALEVFRKFKGADVMLLLKYTDGSGVVTPVDCKRERFGTSWVETAHPRHNPEGFERLMREYGAGA